MSALSPVFGQEESVPVLEEVNAPGLHRASPAKIHTSQVDLVRFRQNYNFYKASVGFLHEISQENVFIRASNV
jgi:hypothetical protein